MSKTVKIFTCLVIFLNISNIVFWVLMLAPIKVINIKYVKMLTPIVKVGQQAKFEAYFCKNYDVAGVAQRKLVNHFEYLLAEEVSNQKKIGCDWVTISTPIPLYVEPGIYHIHNDLRHKIFGFRTIHTHYETPQFEVIK